MPATPSLERLQGLFRELFQLDLADLDFGLYRLLHLKRAEVEAFLTEQLPRQVDEAFASLADEEAVALAKDVGELAEQIKSDIAADALTPTGEVKEEYRESTIKVVKDLVAAYEEKRHRLQAVEATEAHKAEVFNHLYNFFSRYYEDGDFIPRRRYGARESYAVPYDGQEVFFHWANRDQHYVKSAETLKDCAFNVETVAGRYRIRFALTEASVPKDNTKGDYRFFFPRPDLASYDEAARGFRLPFEYRLPTEKEAARYGTNAKGQEALSAESVPAILKAIPDETLRTALVADQRTDREREEEKPQVPLILKRLRYFTKRQTTDFFIHKDLRRFLRRELEFYVKDQVLNLADIEGDLDAKRRMIRVLRRLGEQVIEFLAQIEDAQKCLFEKKKFVLKTDYLVPIQHVPHPLWPEILKNKAQVTQWKDWFAIRPKKDLFNKSGRVNEAFLEAHPTLVVNTEHFDGDFRRRLLEALPFEDLDEATDGLLVHGENYQALRLLGERYRGEVKCTYIDPPYNSKTTEILYKNGYKHASWLALMAARLSTGKVLMSQDGCLVVAVDENEQERLGLLLDSAYSRLERTCVSVVHNPRGIQGENFSYCHEYAYFVYPEGRACILPQRAPRDEWEFQNLRNWGGESEREDGRNCFYPIYVREGRIVRLGDVPQDDFHPKAKVVPKAGGEKEVWPIDRGGVERKWRYMRESLEQVLFAARVVEDGEDTEIELARFQKPYKTVWVSPKYDANTYGSRLLQDIVGVAFSFPKSLYTVLDCVKALVPEDSEAVVLDYFAGSGTTGHAVICMNRANSTSTPKRFVLVELGAYFDSILIPRIAKIAFTPEWKDGKPKRTATKEEAERSPRLVKILRLESYEDALHNIATDAVQERAAAREVAHKAVVGEDEYRLKYLVRLPLDAADTMLSAAQLEHPFDYTLEILTDEGPVRKTVDLVETFNYLYGLRVRKLATWVNADDKTAKEKDGRAYRVVRATDREKRRRVLVLWRDMTDLRPEAERAFLEAKLKGEGQAYDQVLINSDTATPGVESLDPLFKRLMMAEEAATA